MVLRMFSRFTEADGVHRPHASKSTGTAGAPGYSVNRAIHHSYLWLLAVLVGVVSGCGAMVFRALIAFFHNVFFLGRFSWGYDANAHTPVGHWGAGVIIVPVLGAFGVAYLVKNYALEAKGHGVPEVMDAIYYHKGLIRPVVAVIKSLASALSIGSGGSVGREGPIVQIGSSFGSTMGQWLRLPAWQRITLIAAGAGGGIAATFNTPIGGVLFAAELLLHEVSVWTLVPVVISTATATYIGRLFFGASPSFVIPAFESTFFHPTNPQVLLAYVGLGLLMGLVSAVFIRAIYSCEDFFDEKVPGNYYIRHCGGMLVVGLILYLLSSYYGHYYVAGVGYAAVQDVLSGTLTSFFLVVLLFLLKILATSITLGSGGSGGIFSPSLFVGATFGAAYGLVLKRIFPGLPLSPPAFAVVGMAGMVGGVTGAAITAIVMIFEMTLDYQVILPMTITVAISYGIRKFFCGESIYTSKLARRGHRMPEALQSNFAMVRLARDLMETNFARVSVSDLPAQAAAAAGNGATPQCFLVEDHGKICGVLDGGPVVKKLIQRCDPTRLAEAADRNYEVISETTTMLEIISLMHTRNVRVFLVSSDSNQEDPSPIRGVITKGRIADSLAESVKLLRE